MPAARVKSSKPGQYLSLGDSKTEGGETRSLEHKADGGETGSLGVSQQT